MLHHADDTELGRQRVQINTLSTSFKGKTQEKGLKDREEKTVRGLQQKWILSQGQSSLPQKARDGPDLGAE